MQKFTLLIANVREEIPDHIRIGAFDINNEQMKVHLTNVLRDANNQLQEFVLNRGVML
jgi:hypothetical protein